MIISVGYRIKSNDTKETDFDKVVKMIKTEKKT